MKRRKKHTFPGYRGEPNGQGIGAYTELFARFRQPHFRLGEGKPALTKQERFASLPRFFDRQLQRRVRAVPMESSMRKSSLFIFASMMCIGALPAVAAVHELGAVNVSSDHYTHVSWTRFDGPVDRLSFVPATDAVDCDHITVNYLDGTSHDVFSGRLLEGQRETISFPGDDAQDRRLASVTFSCRAENVDGARIALSAVTDGSRFADDDPDAPAHLRTYEGGDGLYDR